MDLQSVAEEFEWFADWAEGVAPLYERLARAAADDERLLEIAGESAGGQPSPNLLFGAVHAHLLDDTDHRLADFYPTRRDDPVDPDAVDPVPAFRDFCLANEASLRELVATRRVQTNEVGRAAVLFPAFKHLVERRADEPLALVEIGASAGLNLYWDRFRYEYEGYGTYGNSDSDVRIESDVRGSTAPPFWERDREPEVGYRVGIDVNPLDVTDSADARWLRALVMPDHRRRFDRLDDAIELVADDPLRLVAGDALEVLPDVLAEIPDEFEICVFSTLVLYQFDERDLEALRDLLREQSARRTIHWLSNDPAGDQTLPTYRYGWFDEKDGLRTRRLAEYKAHGEWIRWLATPRS